MNRFDYAQFGAKAMAVRGTDLPHAKLNEDTVRSIRSNPKGLTAKQQAAEHGVHFRTIEKVRSFESWGHVR